MYDHWAVGVYKYICIIYHETLNWPKQTTIKHNNNWQKTAQLCRITHKTCFIKFYTLPGIPYQLPYTDRKAVREEAENPPHRSRSKQPDHRGG